MISLNSYYDNRIYIHRRISLNFNRNRVIKKKTNTNIKLLAMTHERRAEIHVLMMEASRGSFPSSKDRRYFVNFELYPKRDDHSNFSSELF